MYKLYLDSSGAILTIVITKNNKILASYSKSALQKQTELALKTIDKMLNKLNLSLKKIKDIIITNGPGSYTGIRVAITFAKTLLVLNPKIQIFTINSLLLQVGLKKAISIIKGYNDKSYLAVFNQGNEIIATQLVNDEAKIGIINDLKHYSIISDFKEVNIINNFLILNSKLKKINKIEDLQSLYIGDNFN